MSITVAVGRVADANGSAFVTVESTYKPDVVSALAALAREAGASEALIGQITPADLVALYATARKRAESAQLVVNRLEQKYGTKNQKEIERYAQEAPSASIEQLDTLKQELSRLSGRLDVVDGSTLAELDNIKGRLADLTSTLDASIAAEVDKAIKAQTPTSLVVQFPNKPKPVDVGVCHFKTPEIIRELSIGHHVYLHGPAGSGKTTMASVAAKALGLTFRAMGKVESEYLLLGFQNANGVVRTEFREAFEHGGLILFDEFDAFSAGAVVALNMALANKMCSFPDGMVQQHKDFRCIAAGNTVLTGATREYQGRTALDGASIDRFAFIEFPYDEQLELHLGTNRGWTLHVQAIRKALKERGVSHLVTPRASYSGAESIAAGASWEKAETTHIFKGLDAATVAQVRAMVGNPLIGNGSAVNA